MAEAVYALCFLTCVACAALLARGFRRSGVRLLFWSALCFVGLAANNLLLFLDVVVFPDLDLTVWRTAAALAGMSVLLYGLIWDAE